MSLKHAILKLPLVGDAVRAVVRIWRRRRADFPGSAEYWRERYRQGGDSGLGSRGMLAAYKAGFLNAFVEREEIGTVIEMGCGDGYQLGLAEYPKYVGYDISEDAIFMCRARFQMDNGKQFLLLPQEELEQGDLSISLDVIFHLVEDDVFHEYMKDLFSCSNRFVIIYSSNSDVNDPAYLDHMKNREFTRWIDENAKGWRLISRTPNPYPMKDDFAGGSISDFFVYERE